MTDLVAHLIGRTGTLVALSFGMMLSALPIWASPSRAQVPPPVVPMELQKFTTRTDGRVHFCINQASSLAGFDRAVAQTLSDYLMVESAFIDIVDVDAAMPLDHRFTVSDADLFLTVNNDCDVLMGYELPMFGAIAEWLTVSRPYYSPRVVLAHLSQAPEGSEIGSVLGTAANALLRTALKADASKSRRLYPDHQRLIEALLAGEVGAIAVWEPALFLHFGGPPDEHGVVIDHLPVSAAGLQFSAAMPTRATYLRVALDEAIANAIADGAIDRVADDMHLPHGRGD